MNVLLTYVGGIAGQSIIKSLKKSKYCRDLKIFGLDCDEYAPSLKWVDVGIVCPKSKTEEYEKFIRKLMDNEKIDLYIPTGDEDLPFFSTLKSKYKETVFYMSDFETINLCQNKFEFYLKCKNDFDLPFTSINPLDIPYFEKPIYGRGSRGARLINNERDIHHKEGMIYQEYIPGEEWSVDTLCNLKGEVLNITPRKRILIKSGISTQSKIELNKDIIDISYKLIKFLNIRGPACVQYKLDKNFNVKLIELNPRFGGGIIFTTLAGINHAEMILDNFYNRPINTKIFAKEIMVSRFWEEIIL